MKKRIVVEYGKISQISKDFKVTRQAVYKALNYLSNSSNIDGRDLFFSSVLNFKMTIGGFQVSRFHEPSFLTHTYVHYKGFK